MYKSTAMDKERPRCCSSILRAARNGHVSCALGLSKSLSKSELFEAVNSHDNTGKSPLHFAAGKGLADFVSLLIDLGASVDWKDWDGNTALHHVGRSLDEDSAAECACHLLEAGADVSSRNLSNQTPLHQGARHLGLIRALLSGGASVLEKDDDGWTALHFAAHHPVADEACLRIFLDLEPSLSREKTCAGLTALRIACISAAVEDWQEKGEGAIAAVETLIKYGANVNEVPDSGQHIISELCGLEGGERQSALVLLLTRHGARIPPGGGELLDAVTVSCSAEFVRCLLKVPGMSFSGDCPRDHAGALSAAVPNLEMVKILLDAGANANSHPPNSTTKTPLRECARIAFSNDDPYKTCDEVYSLLMNAGARLSLVCCCHGSFDEGATCGPGALIDAVLHRNEKIMLRLLDAGVDPNSTCLGVACQVREPPLVSAICRLGRPGQRVVETLLFYGADPSGVCEKLHCVPLLKYNVRGANLPLLCKLLDLLPVFSLDFGGCTIAEHFSELLALASEPRPLMHLCRVAICARIRENRYRGPAFLNTIYSLPLPPLMFEFLVEPFGKSFFEES